MCSWWAVTSTEGDAWLWLGLWEAWVLLHLVAVYYLRGLKNSLEAPTSSKSAGSGWLSAIPWRLLWFHLMRAILLPVGMGFLPYWFAAASL